MPLFTIVLDHAGGTYIAQVSARSTIHALKKWVKLAPSQGIPALGPAFTTRALKDLLFLDPTPIEGLRNAWCTSIIIRGSLGLVNIVATNRVATPTGVSKYEKAYGLNSKKSKKVQQDGDGQPSTRPESKSKDSDKSQPEAEGRSR